MAWTLKAAEAAGWKAAAGGLTKWFDSHYKEALSPDIAEELERQHGQRVEASKQAELAAAEELRAKADEIEAKHAELTNG